LKFIAVMELRVRPPDLSQATVKGKTATGGKVKVKAGGAR